MNTRTALAALPAGTTLMGGIGPGETYPHTLLALLLDEEEGPHYLTDTGHLVPVGQDAQIEAPTTILPAPPGAVAPMLDVDDDRVRLDWIPVVAIEVEAGEYGEVFGKFYATRGDGGWTRTRHWAPAGISAAGRAELVEASLCDVAPVSMGGDRHRTFAPILRDLSRALLGADPAGTLAAAESDEGWRP